MEESTCHEMVIDLLKRFSCMKCLFLHFSFSSKYHFHFNAERIIAINPEKCQEISASIFKKKNLMARKIFRKDIYRSHPTIKVAQYYYFLHVTLGILGTQGHDIFAFCLKFSWDSRSPTFYKQLCQKIVVLSNVWTTSLHRSGFKSHKYNLSQKA